MTIAVHRDRKTAMARKGLDGLWPQVCFNPD